MTIADAEIVEGTFDDVAEYSDSFEDGQYVLTVVRIEAAAEGKFGPSLKWVFTMADAATGELVTYPNSPDLYEFFQFSSRKMTPRTKHYPWVEAFLGRPLQIGESGAKLVRRLMGAQALSYVGRAADDGPTGRQKILTIKPVPAAKPAVRRTAPAPASVPPAEEDDEAKLLAQLEATRQRKAAENQAKAGAATGRAPDRTYEELFEDEAADHPA